MQEPEPEPQPDHSTGLSSIRAVSEQLCAAVTEEYEKLAAETTRQTRLRKLEEEKSVAKCKELVVELQRKQNLLDAEKAAMANVQEFQSSRIVLDVGGVSFATSRGTLTAVPDSMLAAMFSGRHKLAPNEDGSYFIDRDPEYFRHILNYLRNGTIQVELGTAMAKEVALEADFYGLQELVAVLSATTLDITKYLGAEITAMREKEIALRAPLGIPKSPSRGPPALLNPHEGLISVFEDDGALAQMNEKATDPMNFFKLLPRFGRQISTVTDLAAFRSNFKSAMVGFNESKHGVLERLTPIMKDEPIIIAGGAVLRALTLHPDTPGQHITDPLKRQLGKAGDIDIFVCTQDAAQASQVAQRVFLALTANREVYEFQVTRSAGVINIELFPEEATYWPSERTADMVTVQIVLRLYESPAEVLLGFDCDCCCLGFDGERVWALPRALRAIQYGTNILNPLHAWPTKASYEFRLVKYALKGYSIAVPGMETVDVDLTKIIGTPLSKLKGFARLIRLAQAFDDTYVDGRDGQDVRAPSYLCTEETVRHPGQRDWDWSSEYNNSNDETGRQELATTLRAALGEYEYTRLTAANWVYGSDASGGGIVCTIPENILSGLGMVHERGSSAWATIEECTDERAANLTIPTKLVDAWDCAKRSREYLNAAETDLDARYFAHAARDAPTTCQVIPRQRIQK